MSEPDSSQIVAGSGLLYIAPLGTAIPSLNVHGEFPVTWPAGWVAVGYTQKGIDIVYTPTIKELRVDEATAPVGDILEQEKFAIAVSLAEANLPNLANAVSASTITTNTAGGTIQLSAGAQAIKYVMLGIQAPAPSPNKGRIVICQKVIAKAAVSLKINRTEMVTYNVSWEARQVSGFNLFDIYDFTATAS